MAMVEGEVKIDSITGGIEKSEGAAGVIFDFMDDKQDYGEAVGPALANAREAVANVARGVAKLIPYIQSNAQISTNVNVTSVGGVTTGAGTSGPGTGSGTGTIA